MRQSIFIVLAVVFVGLVATVAFVGSLALKYKRAAEQKPQVVEYTRIQNSFLTASVSGAADRDIFANGKSELIAGGGSFIEADLEEMKITLYENGAVKESFPIASKGRDGSWWETPTGRYLVLAKEVQHFSSIGRVWMPWSIQFYGNFFIHGWPRYKDGTPVAPSYSGGCIRLANEDAEKVFSFAKKGMPIIVLDEGLEPVIKPALQPIRSNITSPVESSAAALITDLDTGAILLDKRSGDLLPVASLAKLMTATVASELIYLGRSVAISPNMLRDAVQSYPLETGGRYLAFDLLYPLLKESSNGSARALAAMIGEGFFVSQMNKKAKALGMEESIFIDPAGVEDGNVSSLRDFAKLAKYILEKRRFIFDISRGEVFSVFGQTPLSSVRNFNEFADDPALIGMKNGKTEVAKETILSVWNFKDSGGTERRIMIGVLGSNDRVADTSVLRFWLKDNFGLQ